MKKYTQEFVTSLPVDLLAKELYRLLIQEINNIEPEQIEYYTRVTEAIIDPIANNSNACAHLFNTLNGWIKLPTPLDKVILDNVEQSSQDVKPQELASTEVQYKEVIAQQEADEHNYLQLSEGDYVGFNTSAVDTETNYGTLSFAGFTSIVGKIEKKDKGRIKVKFSAIRNNDVVSFSYFFAISELSYLPAGTGKEREANYINELRMRTEIH